MYTVSLLNQSYSVPEQNETGYGPALTAGQIVTACSSQSASTTHLVWDSCSVPSQSPPLTAHQTANSTNSYAKQQATYIIIQAVIFGLLVRGNKWGEFLDLCRS